MSDATIELENPGIENIEAVEALGATVIWDGSPKTITTLGDTLLMPQTPNGSTVFAYQNKATLNNQGQLALSSGGDTPVMLDVPALVQQPAIYTANWGGNNLTVNNVSQQDATPIWVEAFGPGLPGQTPITFTAGTPFKLDPQPSATSVAQGVTKPGNMLLRLKSNTGDLTIVAVIGGKADSSGNNAYVFALNSPDTSQPGYTKATGGNSIDFPTNWSSSVIYIANLSPATAGSATINLVGL